MKDFLCFEKSITKNKNLSIQISEFDNKYHVFDFNVSLTTKGQDHAGLFFSIGIWKYYLFVEIFDYRHWDEKENRWCDPKIPKEW